MNSKILFILPALVLITACGNTPEKIDVKKPVSSGSMIQAEQSNTNKVLEQNNGATSSPVSDTENQNRESTSQAKSPTSKILSCKGVLREDNKALPERERSDWVAFLKKFYPTFSDVEVGDVCTLDNGQILVTASLDGPATETIHPEEGSYKKVILFDKNRKHLLSTTGLSCFNMGDVSFPLIDEKNSIKDGFIYVTCGGGDAGHTRQDTFRINSNDFSFGLIKQVMTDPKEGYITGEEDQVFIETTKELQPDGTWKVTEKKV